MEQLDLPVLLVNKVFQEPQQHRAAQALQVLTGRLGLPGRLEQVLQALLELMDQMVLLERLDQQVPQDLVELDRQVLLDRLVLLAQQV
jgi:hypothetical protein